QYFVTRSRNVGSSVGILYCLNTLGSAAACFVSAFWLMRSLGMHNSVKVAAVINFFVGLMGLYLGYWSRHKPIPSSIEGPFSPQGSATFSVQQRIGPRVSVRGCVACGVHRAIVRSGVVPCVPHRHEPIASLRPDSRSIPQRPLRITRGAGSGKHLASVLQE